MDLSTLDCKRTFLENFIKPLILKYNADLQSPFPTIAPCLQGGGKSILYIDYALVLGVEFGSPFHELTMIKTITRFSAVILLLTIWIGVKQCTRK